jgi:predicted glycoside hydrolase/deacetylase ChbG (UPF0249 family)
MSGRQLIFNADDYGLSPAVSSAIIECMQQGCLRSTTVMANLATPEELERLRCWLAEDDPVAIRCTAGCHLNLSCGPALLAGYPERLMRPGPDGAAWFDKQQALRAETWEDRELAALAAHEWELQLRALLASGVPVSHLDSHHHVHLLRPLFPVALELAQRHGLALRTRREYRSLARASGVATPDTLLEGYFGADSISLQHLLRLLQDADGECVEVMCHPGRVDAQLRERSGYCIEREAELAVLGSPQFAAALAKDGWELRGYQWADQALAG